MYVVGYMSFWPCLGSWSNFKAIKQITRQSLSREILLLLDWAFFFFSLQRFTQTLFLFLESWKTREVPAPAQPRGKLQEPRVFSVKGSSFHTKNTDIVCHQPQATLQGVGWLARSLQQLGPKSPCCVPGWGLLGTTAGGRQPSFMLLLLPLWILQWDGKGLLSWSLLLCSRRTGTRCHQPTQLASTHQYDLTHSLPAPALH